MDFYELEKLDSELAKETTAFTRDFTKLYKKWFKKSPRMTVVMTLHLPINIIMDMISKKLPVYEFFPELPDMFIRFLCPFIKLREKWGKIPGDEFAKEYHELYESQFKKMFSTNEQQENFKK